MSRSEIEFISAAFEIKNGIPRFVTGPQYADSFGYQWHQFKRTQLDSESGLQISAERLRRCLGREFDKLSGARVLEVGCGAGRFTEVLLAQGALVTSVDLSSAVEINAELFPLGERHKVLQADMNALPFKPGQFEYVICLGVLQHTPKPEQSIANLYAMVKPSGYLCLDHYTFNLSYLGLRLIYRQIFKRLPEQLTHTLIMKLAQILVPVHALASKNIWLRRILNRLSPMVTYFDSLPGLSYQQQMEWAILDTFDSLTDHFKHFRNRAQILRTLDDLGAEVSRCEYGGNGVEALAKRPLHGRLAN